MKNKHDTLCWCCEKAGGNCSWSENFTPVDGWTAKPTKITSHDSPTGYVDSYNVYKCPEFELLRSIENDDIAKLRWYKTLITNEEANDGV